VVDQSLLRQASDRGVTICFADLDGADGLWVPEERTVLVSRRLSEQEVAEVIEHELAHVMIDDQHADLDAGRDVLVNRPPVRSRRWAAALTAAGLVAVVGGVTIGIAKATGGPVRQEQVVAPTGQGTLTAQESGPAPGTTVIPSRGPDGRIVYKTVVVTETAPLPTSSGSPAGSLAPTRTATAPTARATVAVPPAGQSVSPTPPPVQVTLNPPTASPTPEPPTTTEPAPTTPAGASESGAAGQTDAGTASDVGDVPPIDASDVAVAGSGVVDPIVDPTG
jgi:Putative metallopeptidase family (DUF6782)